MSSGRTDQQDPNPGVFRDDLVYITADVPAWKDPVRFVPPKPSMAESRMSDLESYIQGGGRYHPLIDVALVHYQFETIHPFADGNGRLGRLLVVLLLYCAELLTNPVLYLSSYINRHRDVYTDRLLAVSEQGAWDEWIDFFLTGLAEQADEAVVRAKLLLETRRTYADRYTDARSVSRLSRRLFERPYVTKSEAADLIDMSYEAGRQAVERLVDDGVLVPHDGDWDAVYRADEIMTIVERDAQQLPAVSSVLTSEQTRGSWTGPPQ